MELSLNLARHNKNYRIEAPMIDIEVGNWKDFIEQMLRK